MLAQEGHVACRAEKRRPPRIRKSFRGLAFETAARHLFAAATFPRGNVFGGVALPLGNALIIGNAGIPAAGSGVTP